MAMKNRVDFMKLKALDIVSEVLFLVSSSGLLVIPFLDFNDTLSAAAYVVASMFWGGLILGIIIQIILFVICKKTTKSKKSRTRQMVGITFLISVIILIPVLAFCNDNEFILPINLFLILFSAETYFVLKRMECLK